MYPWRVVSIILWGSAHLLQLHAYKWGKYITFFRLQWCHLQRSFPLLGEVRKMYTCHSESHIGKSLCECVGCSCSVRIPETEQEHSTQVSLMPVATLKPSRDKQLSAKGIFLRWQELLTLSAIIPLEPHFGMKERRQKPNICMKNEGLPEARHSQKMTQ